MEDLEIDEHEEEWDRPWSDIEVELPQPQAETSAGAVAAEEGPVPAPKPPALVQSNSKLARLLCLRVMYGRNPPKEAELAQLVEFTSQGY